MKPSNHFLGPRQVLDTLRCHKLSWKRLYSPREEFDQEQSEALFDQRLELELLLQEHFSNPKLISAVNENFSALPKTNLAHYLQQTKDTFETKQIIAGGLIYHFGFYARLPLLRPLPRNEWELIFITPARELRETFIQDASAAWWLLTKELTGTIKVKIATLERHFVKAGPIKASSLFRFHDISRSAQAWGKRFSEVPQILQGLSDLPIFPEVPTGNHCLYPTPCPLKSKCLPENTQHSVFSLYRGKKMALDLISKGITQLTDIPDQYEMQEVHRIQIFCEKNKLAFFNKSALTHFLNRLTYPLYFIDFEAYQTALPLHDGTRPYQIIPFQFSLHILRHSETKALEHISFLAEPQSDPRPAFIQALKKAIQPTGSLIAFNVGFESTRLEELAQDFPGEEPFLRTLLPRFVDYWDPFRFFYFYHPDQKGKTGIKTLLPIMSDKSYDNLNLRDGQEASLTFMATHLRSEPSVNLKQIREDLETYCTQDSESLALIHFAFQRFLKNPDFEKNPFLSGFGIKL